MEKIILNIASSLDGYIARENGDIDWLPESGTSGYDEFYKTIETVVMGKTTYDQVLTFGAYPYREKKSYVFTRNSEKVIHHDEKSAKCHFFGSDMRTLMADNFCKTFFVVVYIETFW